MPRQDSRSIETRRRLLEAAGEAFAEHGFRHATIQEICRRAGANIAAVHYHFRDKEHLYRAVIEYADRCANESYPVDGIERVTGTPEERLRARIQFFLLRLLDEGRPAWHGALIAREMIDPTAALDDIVHERVRATYDAFTALVRNVVGTRVPAETVRLCVQSIIAQCVYYRQSRAIIVRLFPDEPLGRAQVAPLAAHITRFSLGGIRQFGGLEPMPARGPRSASRRAQQRRSM